MRAFVGVPMTAFAELVQLLEKLRASRADLKIVDGKQFHLTLKFLGEVRPELAEGLLKLARASSLPAAFDVAIRDVGAFPNWKKLNVVWAGIEDPTGGLGKLFEVVEAASVSLGQAPEERPFSPHLTLARKRGDGGSQEARAVLTEYRGLSFGTVHVDHFNLCRSTLTPQGPVYDVVGEVRL